MTTANFFKCPVCGNVAYQATEGGGTMICCGQPMEELVPNSTDANPETHKPVLSIKDDVLYIRVGEKDHPMTTEHGIRWVAVTAPGIVAFKHLDPTGEPVAQFGIADAAPESVVAYCNKHGLWETPIEL